MQWNFFVNFLTFFVLLVYFSELFGPKGASTKIKIRDIIVDFMLKNEAITMKARLFKVTKNLFIYNSGYRPLTW